VDHGKTTICDSLLAKSGLLNRKKAGTACALDTSAEEQERGITIHSTAVSMTFKMPSELLQQRLEQHQDEVQAADAADTADAADPDTDAGAVADAAAGADAAPPARRKLLYFGNLTFGTSKAEFVAMVGAVDEAATIERFNSKRGFAVAEPSTAAKAEALLALNGTTFKERVLTVQLFGRSARHQLRKLFMERELKPSDITTTSTGGVMLPQGLGLVQLPSRGKGAVAQKEAVAQTVVDYLETYSSKHQVGGGAKDGGGAEVDTEHEHEHEHEHEDKGTSLEGETSLDLKLGAGSESDGSDSLPAQLTVNCIDSPGHVDFNSEVTAALRITDGALVIVDALDGPCVMTFNVLRQAVQERVRPVLLLNKVDRLILEQQLTPPEMMARFKSTIAEINGCIADEQEAMRAEAEEHGMDSQLPDWRVSLEDGTVAFGSGYFGWALAIPTAMERLAARVVAMPPAKQPAWAQEAALQGGHAQVVAVMRDVWFGPKAFDKSVCQHILRPLKRLHELCQAQYGEFNDDAAASGGGGGSGLATLSPALTELLRQQGLTEIVESAATGNKDEWHEVLEGKPKDLIRWIMKLWCPAADALVRLIALKLPSPIEAQRYRAPLLYCGPVDGNKVGRAVAKCSSTAEAPLTIFVTKLCPLSSKPGSKPVLGALARVLSGVVRVGQEVSVLPPGYEPPHDPALPTAEGEAGVEEAATVKRAKIKRIVLFKGGKESTDVREAIAGDVVGLVGLDQVVIKTATLTNHPLPDEPHAVHGLSTLAFNVAPVVRVAVSAVRAEHATALRLGLRALQSTDPGVVVESDVLTGEQVVAAAGELHLDVVLNTLKTFIGSKVQIKVSEPRLAYRESVAAGGDAGGCLAKSANKLNRVWIRASPLAPDLVDALESGRLDPEKSDAAELSRQLVALGGFDKAHASPQRLWAFGPEGGGGANVIVNTTQGVQGMDGLRQSVVAAFRRFCAATASPRPSGCGLCGERMQGVRFDIVDAKVHNDSRHRGPSQIEPAVERALSAAFLEAAPVLYEPTYEVTVTAPAGDLGTLYDALCSRGASGVTHVQMREDVTVTGVLPVALANGLTDELRGATGGRAFPTMQFSGFGQLEGDAVRGDGRAAAVVRAVRERKGLCAEIPQVSSLVDKM